MGSTPPLARAALHITMKLWVSLLLMMVVMVSLTQAAKGGAKSVINRNRRQRNRGGHGIGSNHGDDTLEGVCEFKCGDKETLLSLVRMTFDKLKKNIRMGAGTVTGMGDFSKGPC